MAGIHARDRMPFTFPWTGVPTEDLPRRFAQYHWGVRSTFAPTDFHLDLAVRYDEVLVGVQGFGAKNYPVTLTAEMGSWLGQAYQGRGIGTRMRQVVCALLLDHLGAARVTSGAFVDNPASRAVSRKVGYRDNGRQWVDRQGSVAELQHLVLAPGNFVRGQPVCVDGAGARRRFLGVEEGS